MPVKAISRHPMAASFIRGGLNFNAATQILHTSKLGQMIGLFCCLKFGNHIL